YCLALEAAFTVPKLLEFVYEGGVRVVAQYRVELARQFLKIPGPVKLQCALVHTQQADAVGALGETLGVFGEMGAQVAYTFAAPLVEQGLELAIVFQPHGDWRDVEKVQ